MIYLMATRIKFAENAAYFLRLPRGSWRFAVRGHDLRGLPIEDGDIYIWINTPRYSPTQEERMREDEMATIIKERHIETLEYKLP
jgi:hypothetical protein